MLARDVFVVAALMVSCSLSLTGRFLQWRHGHIERLSIDFKLGSCALSVCRRGVRQLHVNRTCTEHDDSEGQGTKIVQCSCPTLVSRLLCASLVRPEPLRCHCGYGRDLASKPLYRVASKTTTSPSSVRGESSVWWCLDWRCSRLMCLCRRGTHGSVLVVPHRVVFTIVEARQH